MKLKRKSLALGLVLVVLVSVMLLYGQDWQKIAGEIGASPKWSSGWIDFPNTITLNKGDKLRLTIGGTASIIIVRILQSDDSFDDSNGTVGQFVVPQQDRVLIIPLEEDFERVKQISVHGGPSPFGKFSLGEGNGTATLYKVELSRY